MATLPPLPPGATLDSSAGNLPPLPAGAKLDAPPSGVPEWASDLMNYGPGFLKESGKALLRGAGGLLANLGEGAGALAGEGMRDPNVTASIKPQQEITRALPNNLPDTPSGKLYNRGLEGAGSAAIMPIPGAGIVPQLASGTAAGLAGQEGRAIAEKMAPNSPKVQDWMDILASLFGGGITGFMTGPKQTAGQADIRTALKGTTPAQFDQAAANSAAAQAAGAKTNTAAESFAPGSGVMALASRARMFDADNALRLRTADRPGDLQAMADEFLNRIGPPVDANQVANQAVNSANGVLAETKGVRSAAIGNRLAGQDIPFTDSGDLIQHLNTVGQAQQRAGAGNAFRMVANAMLDQTGQPMTNLQQLSLAIKGLKTRASNPNDVMFSGGQIDKVDLARAIDAAEAGISQVNPVYGQTMKDFRDFSTGPMQAERDSPVGMLADRNPLTAGAPNASRLNVVLGGNSPPVVGGTARTLADPILTGGNPTSTMDIARALAQGKLASGSTNPGATMRGLEGSPAEQQFASLLDAGNGDSAHIMSPLSVADKMQPFAKPAGLAEAPKMQALQYLLRPFRSLDMLTTGQSIGKANAEVAQLLADGSPGAIRRLQGLAMFDPDIRKMLMLRQAVPAAGEGN